MVYIENEHFTPSRAVPLVHVSNQLVTKTPGPSKTGVERNRELAYNLRSN